MIHRIKTQLQRPLPGSDVQQIMAHKPLQAEPIHYWPPLDDHRLAAVLLMLYPASTTDDDWHFALIRRTSIPGDKHSGEMALPGGRHEPGEEFFQTALREAEEETGIDRSALTLIGELTPTYIRASNYLVYPFVAASQEPLFFNHCEREVEEVVETPVASLIGESSRREEIRHLSSHGDCRIPYFDIQGYKVWGATAMILNEFSVIIEQSQLVEQVL